MRSASLNLTPARSSRSSSSTSKPAASRSLRSVSGGEQVFVGDVGDGDDYLERRDGGWQPEAVGVVALLDGCGEDALDADAIAAHDGRDFFAVGVEDAGSHAFGSICGRA